MNRWIRFGIVVAIVTFLVNIGITTLWPDSEVDWYTSTVIAATTAVILTLTERRRLR